MDDELDDEAMTITSRQAHPIDFAIMFTSFLVTVADGVVELIEGVDETLRRHANWKLDRAEFSNSIADDIRRL